MGMKVNISFLLFWINVESNKNPKTQNFKRKESLVILVVSKIQYFFSLDELLRFRETIFKYMFIHSNSTHVCMSLEATKEIQNCFMLCIILHVLSQNWVETTKGWQVGVSIIINRWSWCNCQVLTFFSDS